MPSAEATSGKQDCTLVKEPEPQVRPPSLEQKTPLALLIQKGKYAPVDENLSIGHFRMLQEQVKAHDFIHYEISNFAKEGYYSRHNSIYWLGGHYLGLGPSAHSFNGHSRQWNISNISKYIQLDNFHTSVEEKEVLTIEQRYNEYVMTSLRTVWGCDTVHIRNVFGEKFESYFRCIFSAPSEGCPPCRPSHPTF